MNTVVRAILRMFGQVLRSPKTRLLDRSQVKSNPFIGNYPIAVFNGTEMVNREEILDVNWEETERRVLDSEGRVLRRIITRSREAVAWVSRGDYMRLYYTGIVTPNGPAVLMVFRQVALNGSPPVMTQPRLYCC